MDVQGRRQAKGMGLQNGWWEETSVTRTMYHLGERERIIQQGMISGPQVKPPDIEGKRNAESSGKPPMRKLPYRCNSEHAGTEMRGA